MKKNQSQSGGFNQTPGPLGQDKYVSQSQNDDFFITGLLTQTPNINAASTLPSTNGGKSTAIIPNLKLGGLKNNYSSSNNLLQNQQLSGNQTSRDFFQRRKYEQQKNAVEYLDSVRKLIKFNDRQMIQLQFKSSKETSDLNNPNNNAGNATLVADNQKFEEKRQKFFDKLYSKALIRKPEKRALSQRRLTKDDKLQFQKVYEQNNLLQSQNVLAIQGTLLGGLATSRLTKNNQLKDELTSIKKSLHHYESQEGFRSSRGAHTEKQHKINAEKEFQHLENKANVLWDEVFPNKTSTQIQEMILKSEAIPYVKSEVKNLLDQKEKELIKKRNTDLFKIKVLEKQLDEFKKALQALEIEGQGYDPLRLERLQVQIDENYHKTQNEELYTLILTHMKSRDKKILLCEQEPIPDKKAKLEFYHSQILQCRKDKLEYEREIRIMENDFKDHEIKYQSKYISDENFFNKEVKQAHEVKKYKELYKMEMLKKEEEESEKEKEKQQRRDAQINSEKQEKIKQEQLRIETERVIEEKEEEFKRIQKETMVQNVEELPQYMRDNEAGQYYLKNQIGEIQLSHQQKQQKLQELKEQLYQIMLRKNQISQQAQQPKIVIEQNQNSLQSTTTEGSELPNQVNQKEQELAAISNKRALRKQMLEKKNQMDQYILNVCGVLQKVNRQMKIMQTDTAKNNGEGSQTLQNNKANAFNFAKGLNNIVAGQFRNLQQQNQQSVSENQLAQVNKQNVDENLSLVSLKLQQILIHIYSNKSKATTNHSNLSYKQLSINEYDANTLDSYYNPDTLGIDKNIYIKNLDDNNLQMQTINSNNNANNIIHPLSAMNSNTQGISAEEYHLGLREEKEANQEIRQQYQLMKKKQAKIN
eukprot:403338339